MTAHDQMRAMLDQLMGTGRNGKYISIAFLFVMIKIQSYVQYGGVNYENIIL